VRRAEESPRPDNRSERGFTLIEVLVALCIIAIAFGAIYKAQAQGISMTGESHDLTHAALLAQQKMAEVVSTLPSYGLRRGDFGPDYPGFVWEERVTGYTEFGADLRHVQVSVSWGPQDSARTFALESYVLEPAVVEEDEGDKTDQDKSGQQTATDKSKAKQPTDEDEGGD
jgi:general secretion pathway protein I